MVDLLLLERFFIALALGALIGLEREYATFRKRGNEYAGIRTFPLIALFGALSAYFGDIISPFLLLAGMLIIGILVIVAYFVISVKNKNHFGATSEIAGVLTFFIGVLSYYQEFFLAVVLAVSIAVILYARSLLHHFAEKITQKELAGTLTFAVIAFLILPLLPNTEYGPLGLFNPYITWLMVVLVSGIGFAGYVLMKWFGNKGITLAGILGGLISSTAATSSFSQQSQREKKQYISFALGVILANAVMFLRILVEVFVLNRDLFVRLLLSILLLDALSIGTAYFLWRRSRNGKGKIHLSSPLALAPALTFALFFAAILALVKISDLYLSSQGVYLASVISGLADVDAITLSLSQLAKNGLLLETARRGILLAALTNVAVKGGIAYWLGGKQFSRIVMMVFGALVIFGLLLVFLL